MTGLSTLRPARDLKLHRHYVQLAYDFGLRVTIWRAFCGLLQLQNNVFDCCNQTMIDGWERYGGLCNPLAQGATARAKIKRRRNTPIIRLSSISRITDRQLTHGRHAQWLGQSRTSVSNVLSQNETWWSPVRFPMEQQR